ncbi:Hint domain-containing protein [uncultured Sulfitobacter sp.]|uniref:Hint domain-containing protein n=1 Tax=uncultured Sulfitobacter sp. TaxID=191468 RepID=UPI00263020E0|nr:Hint domain-containing protein [uncultured Sulfitobacter sp.]
MATYTFTGFSPSNLSLPSAGQIRLNSNYDSTAAYRFEITDDDATWSGDSATNSTADDTTRQTTIVYDETGAVVVSGQSYLEYAKTAVDGYGTSIDIFRVMIGTTTVGYVANGQVVPGNTYDFVLTDITPGNEPAYASIVDQTFDPDAQNDMQGTVNGDYQRGYDGNDSLFGRDGNDTLEGWDGDDYVDGGGGNDTLYGWTGNDTVVGGDGNDSMLGGSGNDSMSGGGGRDRLFGEDGNDTLSGGADTDLINGQNGDDLIDGGSGFDNLYGNAGADTVFGGSGADYIFGGTGADSLDGGDDADTFYLENTFGNDTIIGGEGGTDQDTVNLSPVSVAVSITYTSNETGTITNGSDTITFSEIENFVLTNSSDIFDARLSNANTSVSVNTGGGDDIIWTSGGADSVESGTGNDTINVSSGGNDQLSGNEDADEFYILDAAENVTISGGEGVTSGTDDDLLDLSNLTSGATITTTASEAGTVFNGAHTISFTEIERIVLTDQSDNFDGSADSGGVDLDASGGDDFIQGGSGADSLVGGAGNDTFGFQDGFGNDTMHGGAGRDAIELSQLNGPVTIDYTADNSGTITNGNDTVNFSGIEDIVATNSDDYVDGRGSSAGGTFDLGDGDDTLFGTFGSDSILGGEGDDWIDSWGVTSDTIDGGAGNDTLEGGAGDDLIIGGVGDDELLGWTGNDTLQGGIGRDTLTTDVGNDLLSGGDDADTFIITTALEGDTVVGGEGGNLDSDTIDATGIISDLAVSFSGYEAGTFSNGSHTISFSQIENIFGGAGDDSLDARLDTSGVGLFGFDGNDTLRGGSGDDYIDGGDGDDFLTTGEGQDTLFGGAGNDTLMNSAGNDSLVGGDGDDSIIATLGNDTLEGGDGNDTLRGGDDDDSLVGGAGDDLLDGGAGNDEIYGGDGSDSVVFIDGGGEDSVWGGEGGTDVDTLDLSGLSGPISITSTNNIYGTATNGTDTVYFTEFEHFILTDGSDFVDGRNGTDGVTVELRDGDDSIYGTMGDDSLDGGDGTDTFIVTDTFGNDTIIGGEGGTDEDFIDLSNLTGPVTVTYTGDESGTITDGSNTISFSEIERLVLTDQDDDVDASNDTAGIDIDLGAGDDSITDGDGDDRIIAGDGNDYVAANDGNDTIEGGAGDDDIEGGGGSDSIDGGSGNDYLAGFDVNGLAAHSNVVGSDDGAGDFIEGGSGNDTLLGGRGDDSLSGGDDDDILLGGADDDTLDGGAGNDELVGGDGNDTFILSGGNDTITNFNEGNTGALGDSDTTNNDFINLGAYYTDLVELRGDFDDDGELNQSSGDFSDNTSMSGGSLSFSPEAERSSFSADNTGVVCFTTGTAILTQRGNVLIEELVIGDLVVTADNGPQPVRWIGMRRLDTKTLSAAPNLRPILINSHVLQNERPLLVSPQHCMMLGSHNLVRAKHLVEKMAGVRIAHGKRSITYVHLMFDAHQIIFAEGAPSESFYPGPMSLKMIHTKMRHELFTLFPDLKHEQDCRDRIAQNYGETARYVIKKRELPVLFPKRTLSDLKVEHLLT